MPQRASVPELSSNESGWVAGIVRSGDRTRAEVVSPDGVVAFASDVRPLGHLVEFHGVELCPDVDDWWVTRALQALVKEILKVSGFKTFTVRDWPHGPMNSYGANLEVREGEWQTVIWSDLLELETRCFPAALLGLAGYDPDTDTFRAEDPVTGQTQGLVSVNWQDRHVIDFSVLPEFRETTSALGLLMRLRRTAQARGVTKIIADLRHETTAVLLRRMRHRVFGKNEYTVTAEVELGRSQDVLASKDVLTTKSRFVRDFALLELRSRGAVAWATVSYSTGWIVRVLENADDPTCADVRRLAQVVEDQLRQ